MIASIGRNWSRIFEWIKHTIVVSDEVYIWFHFNIILKHNGVSSTNANNYLIALMSTDPFWMTAD